MCVCVLSDYGGVQLRLSTIVMGLSLQVSVGSGPVATPYCKLIVCVFYLVISPILLWMQT